MTKIRMRNYKMLQDFLNVESFLTENYQKEDHNGYFLPEFWEYAHTHPMFNPYKAHRMGIWEENNQIVGIAAYEMDVGDTFLFTKRGHEFLYEELLNYAENELTLSSKDNIQSDIWTTDKQIDVVKLLESKGYELIDEESITVYDYKQGFHETVLPEGFKIHSLEEKNDYDKIHECLWKGFNHGDHPDEDIDCRRLMQTGPHFRKDLSMVVVAPDGSYATFAGMWLNGKNHYAYLEPLATVPKYRKLGLGKAILMEAMKKTKEFGAKYCYGGMFEYYNNLGYQDAGKRRMYRKKWKK